MEVSQPLAEAANHPCHAIEQLGFMLTRLRQHHNPIQHFEDYENEVHALFAQAEREILAEDLSSLDVDTPAIEVNGLCYHRALRSPATYQSAVGPIRVARTLYRHGKEPCIVPMELRAGIVEGYWTPKAAKQAVWMVAQMPPGEAKSLLDLMGNMTPSESALARLPRKFNDRSMGAASWTFRVHSQGKHQSSRKSCHRSGFPGWRDVADERRQASGEARAE